MTQLALLEHVQLPSSEAGHDLGKGQLKNIRQLLKLFPRRHKVVDRILGGAVVRKQEVAE